MGMEIKRFVIGPVMTNVYVLHESTTKEAVVIDPAEKGAEIYDFITDAGLSVAGILLTHGHFDHIGGVDVLREKAGCKVYACSEERDLLSDPHLNESSSMGREDVSVKADVYLSDGEKFNLGKIDIIAIATPGHTKGSMSYYIEKEKVLFSGDTLFEESVGRTDFPTGSMSEIVRSVKEKLMILPNEVTVYPGHGFNTTIGHEREYNPFI